jgi:hypothetical protein
MSATSTTTTNAKPKKIKAIIGLDKMPDGNVTALLNATVKGLTANATIYSRLPVDLTTYQAAISAYEDAVSTAVNGSKVQVAQKNKLRNAVVKMYTLNAHYVEATCNDDMTTFLLSGYQPASITRVPPQPVDVPTIASIVYGPSSGQLKVKVSPVAKALSYDLRYAPLPVNGATPNWTQVTLPSKKAYIVSNLTPGTMYTFEARALGRLGYSDFGAAVNKMAT